MLFLAATGAGNGLCRGAPLLHNDAVSVSLAGMETETENAADEGAASACDALAAIAADRQRLGRRLKSQTWWSAPAQALAVAAVIYSPAAGIALPMTMVLSLATLALVAIDYVVRRRMRMVAVPGPTGPMSLAIIIVLSTAMIGAFALAVVFEVNEQRPWLIVTSAAGFAVALICSALYDLANARELLRVR